MQKFYVYTDGGARSNPGPAGIGVVILSQDKKVLKRIGKFIGNKTNNQAEYAAVIEAMKALNTFKKDNLICPEVEFYLDSQLVVEQLSGNYKIKNEGLKPLYWDIREKIIDLGCKIKFSYIPREQNKEADKLVNIAIDKALK